jgi:hypothetical protein
MNDPIFTDSRGIVILDEGDPRATTCLTCYASWDDSVATAWTPTPAGRCPWEHEHDSCDKDGEPVTSPKTNGLSIQLPVIPLPEQHLHSCDHCGARAIALVWQDGVGPNGEAGLYYGPDCGRCVEFTMPV